jgi:hypothetical protein
MSEQRIHTGTDAPEDESLRLVASLGDPEIVASLGRLETSLDQGVEHSAFMRASLEPFYLQMSRFLHDDNIDDKTKETFIDEEMLEALYAEFQFAPVIEPTVADVALAQKLKGHIEETAECLVESWDDRQMTRVVRVFDETGDSHWVYNSRIEVAVPSIDTWDLRAIGPFRVWWPNIIISPAINAAGEYEAMSPGEAVFVLPDYDSDLTHMAEVIELHNTAAHVARAEIQYPEDVEMVSILPKQIADIALKNAT